ncbi:MAG: PLD nuclease N-terminal domain-containing protein [Verrucomicrobiota bacterium]|nr:PLD nuclease N-terminal domain-containing protein [Verrucomicrobiota bacterium]
MNFALLAQASAEEASGAFGFLAGVGIIGLIIAALTSIFWIWMLIDCATNARLDGTQKIVWILVILFLHVLGALIYFFVGRGGSTTRAAGV